MATTVAKKKAGQVAVADDYTEYEGSGFENQTNEDVALPMFSILQGQSPELETVEGAKPGMIINKVTMALYDGKQGLRFIPALTDHTYVEWIPRDKGGGIVGTYQLDDPLVRAARAKQRIGTHILENGNELVETFYTYGLAVSEEGEAMPAFIAFASTSIRPYQSWMTQARSLMGRRPDGRKFQFPLFSHVYRLTTHKVEKKGYLWHNWSIGFDGGSAENARLKPDDPLFQEAAGVMEAVRSGMARPDLDAQARSQDQVDPDKAPF